MFEISRLFQQVGYLKQSDQFVTNSFLSMCDLSRISKEDESCFLWTERAALIVNDDNGVNRGRFYLASADAAVDLKALALEIHHKPLVVDCIEKTPRINDLSDILCNAGFKKYAELSRWKSDRIKFFSYPFFLNDSFRVATPEDCGSILKMLYDTFDRFISHLPNKEKLLALIKEKLVFCAVVKGDIIAAVCLERIGKKVVYSYQNVVLPEYRSRGIGILLLQFAFYKFRECTRYTAWIEDSNHASSCIHKALGMSCDGLKDHVLILE